MATPNRPLLIGPDAGPEPPYPLRMEGKVISGFGRGSKELGIPTANIPVDHPDVPHTANTTTPHDWITDIKSGVYFGWAAINLPPSHPNYTAPLSQSNGDEQQQSSSSSSSSATAAAAAFSIYPMVMSIGYNPFYKNTVRSAEVHVLHRFDADFYGVDMRLLITGFIREEKDYAGLEALIADIEFDCEVAKRSLAREGWKVRELGGLGEGAAQGRLDGSWLVR